MQRHFHGHLKHCYITRGGNRNRPFEWLVVVKTCIGLLVKGTITVIVTSAINLLKCLQ
jgi:hypothetical protein